MKNLKNLVYSLACLSIAVVVGAAIYEHLAVWPRAFSNPPASLSMLQGVYGLNAGAFWTIIHPIVILLVIASLILHWKSARRKNILIMFIGYIIVMIATATYFVPELMDITGTEYSTTIDKALTQRAHLWINLSLVRLMIIIPLSLVLFFGLTKND